MPRKKSDGRGWFFESVRHSLAAKGIETGRKQREKKRPILIGRYADKWPKKKPMEQAEAVAEPKPKRPMIETDPEKRWLWGIKLTPREKEQIIREAVRETPSAPVAEEPAQPRPQIELRLPAPPSKSVMKQKSKSRKAKFPDIESAWEAAQEELAQRYGDADGSSSGVIKNDAEAEQRLARSMGVR